MKTFILESFTDESGLLGLGVKGMRRGHETNAAREGLTIAHDLIEHVNGVEHIGTIDDELEALGAIWYTRGQHSDLRRDGVGSRFSVHENLSSDVVRMFCDHAEGGAYVDLDVPRTRACYADADFVEILQCSAGDWHKEISAPGKGRNAWPKYRAAALAPHAYRLPQSAAHVRGAWA